MTRASALNATSALSERHLVHGMGTASEAPAWPPITALEAAAVLSRFPDAGRLTALLWHSPRPFSAATLVTSERGEFLLKRHHGSVRSPQGLAEEHHFISHLHDAGVSVPEIMLADDGTGAVAEGEWTYELHRSAPGKDLYRDRHSWTPYLSPRHAFAAGAALARLHLAARGFDPPARRPQPLVASWTILPASDPLAAAEAYVRSRPALAAFLADRRWQRELGRLFETLGQGLSARLARQLPLWTHNDWHPSNLLWRSDGQVETVFDFGLADRTCALHDLATAIERSAIRWLELGTGDDAIADPVAAQALLDGYGSILPLAADDIETVARLLPLVHVEFALSEIDYFAGVVGRGDQAALAFDEYLIGHAQWFLSSPGQAFLAVLRDRAPA